MNDGTLLAAIDLGSNSYRLEIGRLEHGQVRRIEYLKETVRQGNGLDGDCRLTAAAMERGWECLARFSERLASFAPRQVRAVATQTLREARNRDDFLARARTLLGFPIDVIAGREEARLIYQGVARQLPPSDERRLVVDIGGRSTELILGHRFDACTMESYRVGSVAWSLQHFPQGEFTGEAFRRAEVAAQAMLEEGMGAYAPGRWDVVYGSSGTIGAVADILAAAGHAPACVTRAGLQWLKKTLVEARSADRVRLPALKDDRRPVIGGGLSVLCALFDLLRIERMERSRGALRHGVLYDMLEREHRATDVRNATVQRLARKFNTDAAQAQRVGRAAGQLLLQLRAGEDPTVQERLLGKLEWAANLHEIGSQISHGEYHRHGAYIIDNADAPGFAQPELHRLSVLVLGQRGKLRKIEGELADPVLLQQVLCLRLAVILCHARREPQLDKLQLSAHRRGFRLELPPTWAAAFPQSVHLLREEVLAWQKTPWSFTLH